MKQFARALTLILLPAFLRAACQCPESAAEEQLEAATYAFSATVSDTGLDKKTGEKRMTLDVNEIFKGEPGTEIELIDLEGTTDCALDVKDNQQWMVYARWQWGKKVTSRCFGTKRINEAVGDLNVLGPAESWKQKQYPRLRDHCMGKKEVPCCLNSVKTMAAGGYLPEPETGCPEGMIPDRLKCPTSYTWCIPTLDSQKRHR